MFGWSQAIQASIEPSGDTRGDITKSEPAHSVSTRCEPSAATAASSLAGSPPVVSWRSRTQTHQRPSGVTRPSAYRQARGWGGSAVSNIGSAPGASRRRRRWSANST